MEPKFIGDHFTTMILKKMSESGSHHRRSHSDSFVCFLANFNISKPPSLLSLPSLITLDVVPMVMDSDEFDEQKRSIETPIPRHHRSLSAHSYLFNKPWLVIFLQTNLEHILHLLFFHKNISIYFLVQ